MKSVSSVSKELCPPERQHMYFHRDRAGVVAARAAFWIIQVTFYSAKRYE